MEVKASIVLVLCIYIGWIYLRYGGQGINCPHTSETSSIHSLCTLRVNGNRMKCGLGTSSKMRVPIDRQDQEKCQEEIAPCANATKCGVWHQYSACHG